MKFSFAYVFIIVFCLPKFLYSQDPLAEAQTYFESGNYDEVILILEPLSKDSFENNSEINELLGDAYSYTKQWDFAIREYQSLVEIYPDSANYHYKYGGALAMKALNVNKLMAVPLVLDAKTEFLKASELDENHIETHWALVKIYMELPGVLGGSTSKAIQFADELESISPVDGYLAKGYLYEKNENFEEAELYYKKAVDVGGSKTCYVALSDFYVKQNRTEDAILVLKVGYTELNAEELQQKIEEITK